MNIIDLEILQKVLKKASLLEYIGMPTNTYNARVKRNINNGINPDLNVSESEGIISYLKSYGLTYDRNKHEHFPSDVNLYYKEFAPKMELKSEKYSRKEFSKKDKIDAI